MNDSMAGRVLAGDFRAVARLITLVENGEPEAVPLMRALFPHTGRCVSIGITGAPGAGKSTLVDRLAGHYRALNRKVGIIAVDPTSPFTGGAILGDRIRMQSRALDGGTFIRSMATRGNLGGLSRATADVLLIMDAAGFDVVLVETVGVGQDEVEIARTAHLTLVLLVPGMGDDIQAMKAGIMEIGDIFVINKADHAGVERIEAELKALISLSNRPDGWKPAIVRTVATDGTGVDQCAQAIERWGAARKDSPYHREKTVQQQRDRLLDLVRSEVQQSLLRDPIAARRMTELAVQIAERTLDPYSAAEQLLAAWRGGSDSNAL
jgi:LAO/AO transport system kinase